MSGNTIVWIDDRDPRVKFNGTWPRGGSSNDYQSTLSSSTRVGDSFSLKFWGRSITVFGLIDSSSEGAVTNYSMDGRPPVQVTSLRGAGDTPRQQFWSSGALNITQHELTVTMAKISTLDATPGEGTVWFDYFVVDDPSGHEGNPPKRISRGGIAGIAMGCFVFVVLVVYLAVWWTKRRKQRREEEEYRQAHFAHWNSHGYDKRFTRGPVETHIGEANPSWGTASGQSSWAFDGSQLPVRNGIQPFVLGIAPPGHVDPYGSGQTAYLQPPPVALTERDRKRALPTYADVTQSLVRETERPTLPSPSPLYPSALNSPTTTMVEVESAPPHFSLVSGGQLGHHSTPASETYLTASERASTTGAVGYSCPRQKLLGNQFSRETLGNETTTSSAEQSITRSTRATEAGSGSQEVDVTLIASSTGAPEMHPPTEASRGGRSRPIVRVVIAEPNGSLQEPEAMEDEARNGGLMQHADGGMQLVPETRRLPTESPPVYRPT